MKKSLSKVTTLIAGFLLVSQSAFAVSLCGAGSVAKLIEPHKDQIEIQSGQKLEMTTKNVILGLQDLVAGNTEVAMVCGTYERALNYLEVAGDVKTTLKNHPICERKAGFIVHPENSVKSLTDEQVKDIFTGKITNWKDVGGNDAEITVITLNHNNGDRYSLDNFIGEDNLTKNVVERLKVGEIPNVVAQAPNAISHASLDVVAASGQNVKVVNNTAITLPISLVTKGEPTAEQKAIIEAAKMFL